MAFQPTGNLFYGYTLPYLAETSLVLCLRCFYISNSAMKSFSVTRRDLSRDFNGVVLVLMLLLLLLFKATMLELRFTFRGDFSMSVTI